MNQDTTNFIEHVLSVKNEFLIQRQIAIDAKTDENLLDLYDRITDFLKEVVYTVSTANLKINYLNQFKNNIDAFLGFFPYRAQTTNAFVFGNERAIAANLEAQQNGLNEIFRPLKFKLEFFKKLGFFNNNVVVVGANGSGKTSISNKFKEFMANNGVVISAQRILLVPNFQSITNPATTFNELKQIQQVDKTNKGSGNFQVCKMSFK